VKRRRAKLVVMLTVAALILVGASLFVWTWLGDPEPRLVNVLVEPESGIHIGTPVTIGLSVECPWYRRPRLPVETDPGDGLQVLSANRKHLTGIRAGVWHWLCEVRIQPITLGEIESGKAVVRFSPNRAGEPSPVTVQLPEIEVESRLTGDETGLAVADRISADELGIRGGAWRWWVLAAVLVVTAIVVWLVLRRGPEARRGPPPRPSWELAQAALQQLEADLPMAAEVFFVRLTDIVRRYVEKRFDIRAPEQTTPEFLRALHRRDVLAAEHRLMLQDFLTSADLIKFAKADATQEQLTESLVSARRFVADTRPVTDGPPGAAGPAEPREGSARPC